MRQCAAGGVAVEVVWFWITTLPQKVHCQQMDADLCEMLEEEGRVWFLVWWLEFIVCWVWASARVCGFLGGAEGGGFFWLGGGA